jgi:hypothetical protein
MKPFKYTVSFRIGHPNIDPDEISQRLSLVPDTSWIAGSRRRTPAGRMLEGQHKTTYWSYSLEEELDINLADQLYNFAYTIEPHKNFFRYIRTAGGKCEFFIGWFSNASSSEVFSYQLLSKLAELEIDLTFDIYSEHSRCFPTRPTPAWEDNHPGSYR